MKKLVLLAVAILVGTLSAGAQTAKESYFNINGTTYSSAIKSNSNSKDIKTEFTWSNSKDNVSYPIYLHQYMKGEKAGQWTAYIIRVSKKTGKEYKYYLPSGPAIAQDIRNRMGLK